MFSVVNWTHNLCQQQGIRNQDGARKISAVWRPVKCQPLLWYGQFANVGSLNHCPGNWVGDLFPSVTKSIWANKVRLEIIDSPISKIAQNMDHKWLPYYTTTKIAAHIMLAVWHVLNRLYWIDRNRLHSPLHPLFNDLLLWISPATTTTTVAATATAAVVVVVCNHPERRVYMNITKISNFPIFFNNFTWQLCTFTNSKWTKQLFLHILQREFSWNFGSRFVIYSIHMQHNICIQDFYIGKFTLKIQTYYVPGKTDTANRNMHITIKQTKSERTQQQQKTREKESYTRNRTRFPVSTPLVYCLWVSVAISTVCSFI